MKVALVRAFVNMKTVIICITALALLCGCSSNKSEAKKIYERPWIGGKFESVSTPASVRTNQFGKHGVLLTRVYEGTPLAQAGLREGDLALAVNGKNVRHPKDLEKLVGTAPITFTIYRAGEISEKAITPGVERFEKHNSIAFGIKLATRFEIDLWPSPDFSLVALGFSNERERMELRDPKSKYLLELKAAQNPKDSSWTGLGSDERWKFWLGPLEWAQAKMIVSQEPAK